MCEVFIEKNLQIVKSVFSFMNENSLVLLTRVDVYTAFYACAIFD